MIINPNSPLPLYYQLKQLLLDEINQGRWSPGAKLPSEKEIEEKYSVSRTTVRQAIEELVREGTLTRKHGVGSFVAEPKLEHALGKLTSFTDDIRRRGMEPSAQVLKHVLAPAVDSVAEIFGIPNGTPIIELVRLRLANDEPVGIHDVFLSPAAGLTLAELNQAFADPCTSLYALLAKKDVPVIEGHETLEATAATKSEAKLLGTAVRAPLLFIKRVTYTHHQVPIEVSKMIYRADRYKYSVYLSS